MGLHISGQSVVKMRLIVPFRAVHLILPRAPADPHEFHLPNDWIFAGGARIKDNTPPLSKRRLLCPAAAN
jgi:hypothetical protein